MNHVLSILHAQKFNNYNKINICGVHKVSKDQTHIFLFNVFKIACYSAHNNVYSLHIKSVKAELNPLRGHPQNFYLIYELIIGTIIRVKIQVAANHSSKDKAIHPIIDGHALFFINTKYQPYTV